MLCAVGLVYGLAAFAPSRVLNGRSGAPPTHTLLVFTSGASLESQSERLPPERLVRGTDCLCMAAPSQVSPQLALLESPVASFAISAAIVARSEGPAMLHNADSLPLNVPMQLRCADSAQPPLLSPSAWSAHSNRPLPALPALGPVGRAIIHRSSRGLARTHPRDRAHLGRLSRCWSGVRCAPPRSRWSTGKRMPSSP